MEPRTVYITMAGPDSQPIEIFGVYDGKTVAPPEHTDLIKAMFADPERIAMPTGSILSCQVASGAYTIEEMRTARVQARARRS